MNEDLARMRQALERIDATRFVYGALAVRRREAADRGNVRTLRTQMSAATIAAHLEALLRPREARTG